MSKAISLCFDSVEPPETIKDFLEHYTGEGTVLYVAEVEYEGSRTWAKVVFRDTETAEMVKSMADEGFLDWDSYLKARDIGAGRRRHMVHFIDNIILHFGCQVSKEKFSVLWKRKNVLVKFGLGLRKFYLFLSYHLTRYRLELSYENIWQIVLHRPLGQTKKFLRIQLLGGLKIFRAESTTRGCFQEIKEDQWIREVDFSPSLCIGQSSALCLELPSCEQLPNFQDNFVHYKENAGHFFLEELGASGFCQVQDSDLVPIVSSVAQGYGHELPHDILFQVNSLVQHGYLPGPALDADFFRLVDPRKFDVSLIKKALEKLHLSDECCYDPSRWLRDQYRKFLTCGRDRGRPLLINNPAVDDDGLVNVYRVQITPTKVYFCGPEVNLSNRVLRKFPDDIDNFLRVSFLDEDLDRLYSTNISPRRYSAAEGRRSNIYRRILSTLRNGVVIGTKKFEFLGFSQSQLRDNSLWMFASRPGLTAADIREWMGDFRDIKNVAKYAARLGQSFSSSRETFDVGRDEIEIIPDIEVESCGGSVKYIFSDGIGKISAELALSISRKLGFRSYAPSAFQIRYGGYKGVVAVDPTSKMKLSLRESMCKYKSNNTSLDVLAWSKYQACFLNREIIILMSTLGVRDHVFERKQREAISQLDSILSDPLCAKEALELMGSGESTDILKEMLECGYNPDEEPFLAMMLQTFRASKLLDLRTRARIFLPKGRAMMGCLDETGTLEYGQVFVQFSSARNRQFCDEYFSGSGLDHQNRILKQQIVVAKNPCLHPGDIRVLNAVDVPALHHMVDCVVFPQKGKRPHPNECSGSDLDGDVYFVCWDPDLIPPRRHAPMDYTAAPSVALDHDVTLEEVQEYFSDYILNDSLGIICHAHTVFADRKPNMAMSKECKELARLASIAVDFPKTGVPAKIPQHLRVREYPDFMEKPQKRTYESQRVLGKLFRAVKDIASDSDKSRAESFTLEVARRSYDPDMEVDGFKDHVKEALDYKTEYDNKLGNMMDYFGIKTEAEIISGCIMKMAKSFDKKRDMDAVTFAVRSLRKQARSWFGDKRDGDESDDEHDASFAKASAWYYVTYHPSFWGRSNDQETDRPHFLSFPWCVYDKLVEIKKSKVVSARWASSSYTLEQQLRFL
ncbi:hypothetical protein Tsubulata_027402 [Turnera subulata]|uniref:RNA-dependent RNA polymerase n=1 Tax=Turnera subulata TaxID=218843 RepID=A0A9Q0G9H3_9ROSI|nr:hypothetical protein Tsubulata_027402 [Turnera subulata]